MGHNIGDLSAEERAAIAEQRRQALERHTHQKVLEANVEREFNRLLAGKSTHKGQWRAWIRDELMMIRDEAVLKGVRKKLNDWMDSIGG
nr:hypothetical protein [uncultured Pseudomonas sp.]